jgi:hypothetical protein
LLESDANIMNEMVNLGRRETIKVATGLLTGLVIAGSPLSLIARGPVWAVDLSTLTSSEGATLLAVAHTIAPHDKLDDAAYALVVQALDADAAKDETNRSILKEGIARLGPGFATDPEGERVEALKKIESSQFFQAMRLKTLQVLYSNPIAYSYFGYEGEAFSKAGYLHRGFNDLRWLSEVPLEDSGPMPM